MPNNELLNVNEILLQKKTFSSHKQTGPMHMPWQKHNFGRLLMAEKGIIHLKVREKMILVPSWYCAWVPAGTAHEIWSNSKDLLLRTIFFESSFCTNPCFHTLSVFNGSPLFRNMVCYTEKWNEMKEASEYELSFTTVLRQMMPEEMQNAFTICLHSSDEQRFQNVLEHIHQNYDSITPVAQLAKKEYYSVRTLQRLFKQLSGLSYTSYVKTTRILKAIELLSSTQKTISEVAREVGYSSLPTFSNTFKEITGKGPNHFIAKKPPL